MKRKPSQRVEDLRHEHPMMKRTREFVTDYKRGLRMMGKEFLGMHNAEDGMHNDTPFSRAAREGIAKRRRTRNWK